MQKTLYYYNVFIECDGQVTDLHLSDFLDHIYNLEPEDRFKERICLIDMSRPVDNIEDPNDRKITVAKYRDDKPFLGNIGTDRIDEINDDVLELTSIFYRRNSRLFIMEYNHFGARVKVIQKYLTSFLPRTEDHSWRVTLEPIEAKLGFQDIERSNDIKRVEFRMDLTSRSRRLYVEENHKSLLGDIIGQTIEAHNDFGANQAVVAFGNGRKRKNVIEAESLVPLLRALDLDGDIFEGVKVKYRSPTTKKVEEIDIKNHGVLKEVVEVKDTGREAIRNYLEDYFYNNGRIGGNEFNDYEYEPAEMPKLII